MARESRRCWASVLEAPVTLLHAVGIQFGHARPTDACPVCGCAMGGHVAVLPGDITAETFLDRTGWVECENCDVSCGTWALAPRLW